MANGSVQVKQQQTPGPEGIVTLDEHTNPLTFLGELIERYGDVVHYRTQYGQTYLFTHPTHVHNILHRENYRRASLVKMMLGEGLLATDGPQWREQRRLMQKDFHLARIKPFVKVMVDETERTALVWKTQADASSTVDLTNAMTRLTLRIVVESLFSEDLSEDRATELCGAITSTINDLGE